MGFDSIFHKLNYIEEVIDTVTPKISLDTFMESVGDTVDKIILDEKQNNLQFLGGKTRFSLNNGADAVVMDVELFFAKQDGGFVKKETNGQYPINMLNHDARETFVARLTAEGEYVMEVKEP